MKQVPPFQEVVRKALLLEAVLEFSQNSVHHAAKPLNLPPQYGLTDPEDAVEPQTLSSWRPSNFPEAVMVKQLTKDVALDLSIWQALHQSILQTIESMDH